MKYARVDEWLTYPKYQFLLDEGTNYDKAAPLKFFETLPYSFLALISKFNYLGGLGLKYD